MSGRDLKEWAEEWHAALPAFHEIPDACPKCLMTVAFDTPRYKSHRQFHLTNIRCEHMGWECWRCGYKIYTKIAEPEAEE